jgi:3-hydroxybutyryl-CoA dehydrogenase
MTDTVGVLGAGLMGREIALVFALAGHRVILTDRTAEALSAATARLAEIVGKGVARGLMPTEAPAALARIETATDIAAVAPAAFVTEAVFEDEGVKAAVLAAADAALGPTAVLATNTSTIPISVLAAHVRPERRARFIGTHYFSPASRMRLVEVIPGLATAPETVAETRARMEAIGKTPVTIKDVPGFAVNRLLHVFLIEAVRLVEEGVATPEEIDTACRLGLGHPMGPFELMDATTSSLCLTAQEIMFEAYGERFRPRPLLRTRVRAGLTGGRGRPGWRT